MKTEHENLATLPCKILIHASSTKMPKAWADQASSYMVGLLTDAALERQWDNYNELIEDNYLFFYDTDEMEAIHKEDGTLVQVKSVLITNESQTRRIHFPIKECGYWTEPYSLISITYGVHG